MAENVLATALHARLPYEVLSIFHGYLVLVIKPNPSAEPHGNAIFLSLSSTAKASAFGILSFKCPEKK